MTNPYRAMCAELVEAYAWCIEEYMTAPAEEDSLIQRARALLAQPVAEGPSDEEIEEWADACSEAPLEEMDPEVHGWRRCFTAKEFSETIRAVLARWGHPTPQPVPTSERPWERDGWCDAEGRCYGWDGDYWWMVSNPGAADETITHWLPANALPIPEATNE